MTEAFPYNTRSDELPSLRSVLKLFGENAHLVGTIKVWRFVVDANVVLRDLHFLACKARVEDARTDLQECVAAGTVALFAPQFLDVEVEEKIQARSKRWGVEPEAVLGLWSAYRSMIRFVPANSRDAGRDPRLIALEMRDPKDIPYFQALIATQAEAILTADLDLEGCGIVAVRPDIARDLRDYSRSKAEELGVKAPASVVGVASLAMTGKGIQTLFSAVRFAPPPVQAIGLGLAAVALLDRRSRSRISEAAQKLYSGIRAFWGEAEPVLAEMARVALEGGQTADEAVARIEEKVRQASTRASEAI